MNLATYKRLATTLIAQCNAQIKRISQNRLMTPGLKAAEINKLKSALQLRLNSLKAQFESSLPKPPSASVNQVSVTSPVANVPATQTSETPAISLVVTPSKPTGVKRALLIGCNYTGTSSQLSGCINDVNNIKNKLTTLGFDLANIVSLTDKTSTKPTKAVILKALTDLLTTAKEGDILFFQFSGHGSYTFDRSGDEKDGKDEMIIALDLQGILDDELKNIIVTHLKPDVKLLALFDSCHSGTVVDLKYQLLDSTNLDQTTILQNSLETAGDVVVISGCRDDQTSADAYIDASYQGAMTWSLLKTTKAKTSLTWRELLTGMRTNLKSSLYPQIPQLSSGRSLALDSPCILF